MTHGKTQMQTERQGESGKSTGLMRSLNGGWRSWCEASRVAGRRFAQDSCQQENSLGWYDIR